MHTVGMLCDVNVRGAQAKQRKHVEGPGVLADLLVSGHRLFVWGRGDISILLHGHGYHCQFRRSGQRLHSPGPVRSGACRLPTVARRAGLVLRDHSRVVRLVRLGSRIIGDPVDPRVLQAMSPGAQLRG